MGAKQHRGTISTTAIMMGPTLNSWTGTSTTTTSRRQTARLRQVVVLSVLCLVIYYLLLMPGKGRDSHSSRSSSSSSSIAVDSAVNNINTDQKRPHNLPKEVLDNRFLTESQCRMNFPGLLKEIDDEVAKGPFTLKRNPYGLGPTVARIRDGKLFILTHERRVDMSRDMLEHRAATLHSIAKALLTSPPSKDPSSRIPDTILAFNHHDDPLPFTLSYSRPADPELREPGTKRWFPIPHFSFYSWTIPSVGSFPRAQAAIRNVERELASGGSSSSKSPAWWAAKIPRAVWRGTTWFNNVRAGRLRQNLVIATTLSPSPKAPSSPGSSSSSSSSGETRKKKPWADVEALHSSSSSSSSSDSSNALAIEDFCRYRYVIHTEGVTYSGRFQFHQLCASVVLTPPIAWMQHVTHLVRPVFSSSLRGVERDPEVVKATSEHNGGGTGLGGDGEDVLAAYPAPWTRAAWPRSYDAATEANIVFVAPDWSDLESTVAWLEAHPEIASGIAARQRALFDGGGYLSPAAEMCYWRAMIRGWSKVVRFEGQGFEDLEETSWEEFSLREIHK